MTITATAMAALFLAGCGSDDEPVVADDERPEAERPEIELTVEVSRGESTDGTTWQVRCEPAGGDHPQVDGACDTLRGLGPEEAFAPVPGDMQCTMIFGGPQVATVTGHWGEQRIDARFDRTNGCEISRWDALAPLLPKA